MSTEEWLEQARDQLQAGAVVSIRIRDLVRLAGAERRGANVVSAIQRSLDRYDLTTDPPFTAGWIDNTVLIKPSRTPSSSSSEPPSTKAETTAGTPVALTVSSLESATREVATVDRQHTLEQARGHMLANDYSQLAVVSAGPRTLVGAVSWESMAKAALRIRDFTLQDATVGAVTVGMNDSVIDLVPAIIDRGFVFVVGDDKALCGIVTTADLSGQFATLAKPFFLLGEVERRLRHILDERFTPEELEGIVDPDDPRTVSSAGDLTLGEVQFFLDNPTTWARLEWPVDRSVFIARLNRVREIRNEVMHFGPDPLTSTEIAAISSFIKWLTVHDPR